MSPNVHNATGVHHDYSVRQRERTVAMCDKNARSTLESGEGGSGGGMWLIHMVFLSVALVMLYGPGLWNRLKYRRHQHAQA